MFSAIGWLVQNAVYEPVFNLLILFYKIIGDFGIAIVIVAIVAKIVTYPFTKKQIESAKKGKDMQKRIKEIKKEYKSDEKEQAKQIAKLQAEFLPGQLGGCLNIILAIVLLFQIRSAVIDLFGKGVHAANQVAYVEALKFDEDKITVQLPDLDEGQHSLQIKISSEDGNTFDLPVHFAVNGDKDKKKDLEKEIADKIEQSGIKENYSGKGKMEQSDIAVFVQQLDPTTVLAEAPADLIIYLRPPSGQLINYESLELKLGETVVEEAQISTQSGERLSLDSFGMDLSKVAKDFGLNSPRAIPFLILSVLVGITQYYATKIQTGDVEDTPEEKAEKEKKRKDGEEPDFAEIMAESTKTASKLFPIMTIAISAGYFGGGNLFPAGVSLFWTAQNTSVIIQQLLFGKSGSKDAKPKDEIDNSAKKSDKKVIEGEIVQPTDSSSAKAKKKKKGKVKKKK